MTSCRFARPPRRLTCRGVKLDNVALVPASLLPYKEFWQRTANDLPKGSILVYLPRQAKQQHIVRRVAFHFQERGKHVAILGHYRPGAARL